MNSHSMFQMASGGLDKVSYDWMPATGVRAFIFEDPALVWLDHYGEENGFTKDISPYEFTDFIFEKGYAFERKWISEMAEDSVCVCEKGFEVSDANKLKITLDLIERHVPLITGPALWWAPEKVFGIPDLLVLNTWIREHFPELQVCKNSSEQYLVFDMKFTTKLDTSKKKFSLANYSTQVRIYSYIIGQIQGIMPEQGFIVCRDRITDPLEVRVRSIVGEPIDEDIRVIRDKYIDIKVNGANYLPWTNEEVRINLSNDQDEPWHTAKLEIANSKVDGGDISLVYEIGRKQKEDLASQGFPTRDSLLSIDPSEMPFELCYGLGSAKCPLIRAILQANRSGQVTPESIGSVLKARPFEFYVDFETFNNLNVDFDKQWPTLEGCEMIFMIGVGWEENDTWNFKIFIANEENHGYEYKMLKQFQEYLSEKTDDRLTDPESTILYHWTGAEVWQLRRAADRYCLEPKHTLRKLPWYDLQKEVFLVEPIGVPGAWGYKLKEIATELGLVKWPGNLDDGLRASVAGWKAYQTNSPLESVEMKIVSEYNEVDCKALYEILRWLRRAGSLDNV